MGRDQLRGIATGNLPRRCALAVALTLLIASPAAACTLCHTADAVALRHEVFGHGFWNNLFSILLILPLLAGIILMAGMERRRGGSADDDEHT